MYRFAHMGRSSCVQIRTDAGGTQIPQISANTAAGPRPVGATLNAPHLHLRWVTPLRPTEELPRLRGLA